MRNSLNSRFLGPLALSVFLSLAACSHQPVPDNANQNKNIQSFDHYTFAVLWQPGVCATWDYAEAACTDKSPDSQINRQWTMHGLWASIPTELSNKGMAPPTWWKYGCYWYNPDHELPKDSCANPAIDLPTDLRTRLDANMPMTKICLERHEYYKHAVCYGHGKAEFFTGELDLLDRLNATPFTAWINAHRGQWVSNVDIHAAFAKSLGADNAKSLELRCESVGDAHEKHGDILTQAWITIAKDKLDQFPAANSLQAGRTGNCAAMVHILG